MKEVSPSEEECEIEAMKNEKEWMLPQWIMGIIQGEGEGATK